MSTILDALNKLDDEKKRSEAAQNGGAASFINPEEAAKDIIGKDVMRDELTFRLSPLQIIGVIGVASLLVLVATVSFVIWVMRPDAPSPANSNPSSETSLAAAAAVPDVVDMVSEPAIDEDVFPEPTPPANSEKLITPVAPLTVKEKVSREADETPEAAENILKQAIESTPVSETIPTVTAKKTELIGTPVLEEYETENVITHEKEAEKIPVKALNLESEDPPVPPEPAPKKTYQLAESSEIDVAPLKTQTIQEDIVAAPPVPVDIRKFPVLSRAVLSRFELNKVRINMCNPKTNINPNPNAVVNMLKMYVGDTLVGTTLQLTHVEKHGVAFQDRRTGDQYYSKY
jgi:hypothetical protein